MEQIPLAACIVAAVDAYDVMLRGRLYRPKRFRPKSSPAEALEELASNAGSQFDVRVVEAIGRVLGELIESLPKWLLEVLYMVGW